jgi:hypothetical protein
MIDDDGNGRRTLGSQVGSASKFAMRLNLEFLNGLAGLVVQSSKGSD